MRRWRTWQGNNHSLRPPPSLARFLATTRLALKRQQTLDEHLAGAGDQLVHLALHMGFDGLLGAATMGAR